MDVFKLSSIVVTGGAVNQITNSSINPNLEQVLLGGSGHVDPSLVGVARLKPEMGFTTQAIKTALSTFGGTTGWFSGKVIETTGETPFALDMYFAKIPQGGIVSSEADHKKVTPSGGVIVPMTLTAGYQQATLSYLIGLVSSDGSVSPIAFADAALPTDILNSSEGFLLGGVTVNGEAVDGVDSVTIEGGIGLEYTWATGKPYPIHVGITKRQPKITFQSFDVAKPLGWGIAGVAQSATDSEITLNEVVEGAVAGGTPLVFGVDAGMIHAESINGDHGERLGSSLIITPTDDGTNDIITVSGLV